MVQDLTNRQRTPRPRGYLVPLHAEGEPPLSYLFAFTAWRAEEQAISDLQYLIETHGAPWRGRTDIIHLSLTPESLAALPARLLLREAIAASDWSAPDPMETFIWRLQFLSLLRWPGGATFRGDAAKYAFPGWDDPRVKQSGWIGLPEGPVWAGAQALVCVDLDAMHLAVARASARCGLGDFGVVAGVSPVTEFALAGQAQEFKDGGFVSPEETRRRAEQERSEALERIEDQYYSCPVSLERWQYVLSRLRERAREHNRSVRMEWRNATGASLRLVLGDLMPRFLRDLLRELDAKLQRRRKDPERALRSAFPALHAALVKRIRAPLNESLTQDFLGPGWRRGEAGREVLMDRESLEEAGIELAKENFGHGQHLLDEVDRQALLNRARLDTRERELLEDLEEARMHGVSLPEWAAEHGMLRSEADKWLRDVRGRLRRAMT